MAPSNDHDCECEPKNPVPMGAAMDEELEKLADAMIEGSKRKLQEMSHGREAKQQKVPEHAQKKHDFEDAGLTLKLAHQDP